MTNPVKPLTEAELAAIEAEWVPLPLGGAVDVIRDLLAAVKERDAYLFDLVGESDAYARGRYDGAREEREETVAWLRRSREAGLTEADIADLLANRLEGIRLWGGGRWRGERAEPLLPPDRVREENERLRGVIREGVKSLTVGAGESASLRALSADEFFNYFDNQVRRWLESADKALGGAS